jgi:enoyl-CoA hydratase/carnithine racemase
MDYQDIRYQVDGDGVATLTLARPERMNALRYETYRELDDAVLRAQRDESVRCLIVTGEGRGFCAGDDFQSIFLAEDGEERRRDRRLDRIRRGGVLGTVQAFFALEKPAIAAVNGPAVGMGMDLALLCDVRYASPEARFGSYFVRRGVVGSIGGTYLLRHLVGLSRAMELLLTGELVDAEAALEMGLVSKVVPGDLLQKEARAFCERLRQGAPLAQRAIKRVVRKGLETDWRTLDEYAQMLSEPLWESEDHMEGVRSFVERRDPRFKGR